MTDEDILSRLTLRELLDVASVGKIVGAADRAAIESLAVIRNDVAHLRPTSYDRMHRAVQNETYVGGIRRHMPTSKRRELTGRGPAGKVTVAGIRDRATNKVKAQVVPDTTSETLGDFITGSVIPGTKIFTDDATAYTHLPNHASVKHSVKEYVRGEVHTNGIESFWATLKRAHKGTFHRLSAKHLHRYVDEFVGRHNMRELDTLQQMSLIAKRMESAQLRYKDLVA